MSNQLNWHLNLQSTIYKRVISKNTTTCLYINFRVNSVPVFNALPFPTCFIAWDCAFDAIHFLLFAPFSSGVTNGPAEWLRFWDPGKVPPLDCQLSNSLPLILSHLVACSYALATSCDGRDIWTTSTHCSVSSSFCSPIVWVILDDSYHWKWLYP